MQTTHHITVTDKNKVEIDAVTAVRTFDEDGVILESSYGLIALEGKDLKIENFEKASSKILITGNITGVYYLENKEKKKSRGLIR